MGEFDECERKYALHYFWSDFEYFEFPEPLKRNCQFHSKLMGNEAFAGQIVHDVIDETFRAQKEGNLTFADPIQRAREIAREYVADSEAFRKAYEEGGPPPKTHRQPLFRHFFREGFDGTAKAEFRRTVETALVHFFDSKLYMRIRALDPAYWELPPRGTAPWFLDQGLPIYANFDFALREAEKTTIFDWKTGKAGPIAEREVREQLHTYAAYAMVKWGVPPSQLFLDAVWLGIGKDQILEIGVDEAVLASLRRKWRERHVELVRRRDAARGNVERLLELFPTTGIKKKRCRYCAYRFCEGYAAYLASLSSQDQAPKPADSEEASDSE